jgi:hypothetical protein
MTSLIILLGLLSASDIERKAQFRVRLCNETGCKVEALIAKNFWLKWIYTEKIIPAS